MQTGAGDLLCFLSFSHPTESVLLIALGKPAVSWRLKNSLGWLKKCSSCWKCCVQMNRMAPDSGWPPTVDDTTLQTSLWTSNTLDSPLLPDSGTFSSIPGLDFHKMCLLLKPDHCSTVQLFLLWPGKMLMVLSLVQEWLDASVVILDTLTLTSLWSSYILELTFLVNLFEAVVIPVASAPFLQPYLYLPADLPLICVYTSLWTARFFSNKLDWEIHSNYAVLIVSYLMI